MRKTFEVEVCLTPVSDFSRLTVEINIECDNPEGENPSYTIESIKHEDGQDIRSEELNAAAHVRIGERSRDIAKENAQFAYQEHLEFMNERHDKEQDDDNE